MRFLTPAFVTVAMLGVVGVLVGGYFVKNMLAKDDGPPEPKTRNIPMAVADIPAGTLITEAHLGQGPISEAKLTDQRDILLANRVIINRVAKETIKAASPIRSDQLLAPGEFPALEVEPGMRAVSVSVGDSTNLVSGLIKPGQFVDVHLTPSGMPNDERTGGGMTMTLFKSVKVLAVNRGVRIPGAVDRNGNQITLELSPRQSNVMILAKDKGEVTLSYNPEGQLKVQAPGEKDDRATFEEILGLEPLPEPEPPHIIEHYVGSGRSTMAFIEGKHVDVYQATNRNRYGRYGYGYGYGNGSWGAFDFGGMRAPPVDSSHHHYQSNPGGSPDAKNLPFVPPAPTGNGPAPSGPQPRNYPSARNTTPQPMTPFGARG